MNSLSEMVMGTEHGEISLLPKDFWDNLKPEVHDLLPSKNQVGEIAGRDSRNNCLGIYLRRDDTFENPRYHIEILDNKVALEALTKNRAALDMPGYVVGSRTFQNFDTAVGIYIAVGKVLDEMGY